MSSSLLFGFGASTLSLATSSSPFKSSPSRHSACTSTPPCLLSTALGVECSCQVEKVAVHIVVGPLLLKNCLLHACDVFDVKTIQIWSLTSAPSTERVPSLAERVAYLRYLINLRLSNWRVPALVYTHTSILLILLGKISHLATEERQESVRSLF